MSDSLDRDSAERSVSLLPGIIYEWTSNGTLPLDLRSGPILPATDSLPTQLAAGVEIVGGYYLIEKVGEGYTGEVWRAAGPGGVPVALKLIEVGRHGTDQELRSLALMLGIRHANLATIFGIWDRGDWTVIGMDLADSSLLDRYNEALEAGGTGLDFIELTNGLLQVARGVDFLNGLRSSDAGLDPIALVHRDIKPANLLLVGGSLKVGDFGMVRSLAKSVETPAEPGFDEIASLLTAYSSPEVRRGEVSSGSDQYSLAATYCHLRGGYVPATRSEVMAQIDLSMLPARERPAVARAMADQPADRWPSCVEFVEALQTSDRQIDRDDSHDSVRLIALSRMMSTPTSARFRSRWSLVALLLIAACLAMIASVLWPDPRFIVAQKSATPSEKTHVSSSLTVLSPSTATSPQNEIQANNGSQRDPRDVSHLASAPDSPVNLQALVLAHRVMPIRKSVVNAPTVREVPALSGTEIWNGLIRGFLAIQDQFEQAIRPAWKSGWVLVQRLADTDSRASAKARSMPEGPLEPILAASSESEAPLTRRKPLDGVQTVEFSVPKTATMIVRMPSSQAELVVRGEVGRGNPDEWYGPRRVVHSPPLAASQEYIIGAYWTDPDGQPVTRSRKFQVNPGRLYEVDLRSDQPTAVEVNLPPSS